VDHIVWIKAENQYTLHSCISLYSIVHTVLPVTALVYLLLKNDAMLLWNTKKYCLNKTLWIQKIYTAEMFALPIKQRFTVVKSSRSKGTWYKHNFAKIVSSGVVDSSSKSRILTNSFIHTH
jgi:hypothetical protein